MRRQLVAVYLDPPQVEALLTRAKAHSRSLSAEIVIAVREHLARNAAQVQDAQAAPLLDALLQERLGHLETWLRPMMAATSINAATAMLLALELLCGTRVEAERARETLDVMRGRAYRMLRKRDGPDGRE